MEDGVCVACSMHGRHEKCVQNFGRKTEKEETTEDLGVDGRIVLK